MISFRAISVVPFVSKISSGIISPEPSDAKAIAGLSFDEDFVGFEFELELEDLLGPDVPYIKLSVHEGLGLPELKSEILRMLGDVRLVLDAMNAVAMEEDIQQQP